MSARGVLGKWGKQRERDWERGHHDQLARKAAAAWRGWGSKLSTKQRAELNFETRQDKRRRISREIAEARNK